MQPNRRTYESEGFRAHAYLSRAKEAPFGWATKPKSRLTVVLAKGKSAEKPSWKTARTVPTVKHGPEQLTFDFGGHVNLAIANQPSALGLLEKAVEGRDGRAFIEMVRKVKWETLPAGDIIGAVKLAIKAGLPRAARFILKEGERAFPKNDELQKYTRLLAPATALPRPQGEVPDQRSNIAWLKEHGVKYRGKWLALKDGHLLGVEDTLKDLVKKIGDTAGVMLTPVS